MRLNLLNLGAACLALAGLGLSQGCVPPEHYSWGNYDASLYTLAKDPAKFQKYGEDLLAIIERGERNKSVPPGIYAEYGYFLLANGKNGEAVPYFQKEKERWPGSELLMERMIRISTTTKPDAAKG